ncbi:ABC transporter [Alphaproteobacteria bacterium]|nr:ABC transporter [Alphaproteobacteria bacterium]
MAGKTLFQYLLEGISEEERGYSEWKVENLLSDICPDTTLWQKKITELSGGYQRLAAVARGVINDPGLLLIDEPTNYLDLENVIFLEQWLMNEVKMPYLFVSHDREFLDNCTNRTLTLRKGQVIDHRLPYSQSKEAILVKDEADAVQRNLEETEIARIRESIKRLRVFGQGRKARIMGRRADKMERNKTDVYVEDNRKLSLSQEEIRANTMLSIENYPVTTPSGVLLFTVRNLHISRNDRAVLLGQNGAGKTMFINHIMRAAAEPTDIKNNKGERTLLRFNPQIKIGYFDQQLESLDQDRSISEVVNRIEGVTKNKAAGELVAAGFPFAIQNKKVAQLSPGEKARIMFLKLKLEKANFFVLDEPSNHLDIEGQEELEAELQSDRNSCIFISHDRRLVENTANRFLMIKCGVLTEISEPDVFYKAVAIKLKGRQK